MRRGIVLKMITICLTTSLLLINSNSIVYASTEYNAKELVTDYDISRGIAKTILFGGTFWYGGPRGIVLVANEGCFNEGARALLEAEDRNVDKIIANVPEEMAEIEELYEGIDKIERYTEEEKLRRSSYAAYNNKDGYNYLLEMAKRYKYGLNPESAYVTHTPSGDYIITLNGSITQTALDILFQYGYSWADVIALANNLPDKVENIQYEEIAPINIY